MKNIGPGTVSQDFQEKGKIFWWNKKIPVPVSIFCHACLAKKSFSLSTVFTNRELQSFIPIETQNAPVANQLNRKQLNPVFWIRNDLFRIWIKLRIFRKLLKKTLNSIKKKNLPCQLSAIFYSKLQYNSTGTQGPELKIHRPNKN